MRPALTFDELARLSEAEEWFEALQVPFEPRALAPIRLAVLRRFGAELQAIAARPADGDARRLAAARGALEAAYEALRAPGAGSLHRGPLVRLGRAG